MGLVEEAERRSRARAIIFYLLAAVLLLSALLAVADPGESTTRLMPWLVMIALTALNLTSPPFPWRRKPLGALMNDETTRAHRRSSLSAGFWVMILSTAATVAAATFQPLSAAAMGRIIVTAGLMTALITFATLELRASR